MYWYIITNIISITLSIILTNRKISINEIGDIIDTKAEQKQIDDELSDVTI